MFVELAMPQNLPPMPRGLPTGSTCSLCGAPILSGHLVSGVACRDAPPLNAEGERISNVGYYEGHHACVVQALGPDETYAAMGDGRLPCIDPESLVDGCLPRELGGL